MEVLVDVEVLVGFVVVEVLVEVVVEVLVVVVKSASQIPLLTQKI